MILHSSHSIRYLSEVDERELWGQQYSPVSAGFGNSRRSASPLDMPHRGGGPPPPTSIKTITKPQNITQIHSTTKQKEK